MCVCSAGLLVPLRLQHAAFLISGLCVSTSQKQVRTSFGPSHSGPGGHSCPFSS